MEMMNKMLEVTIELLSFGSTKRNSSKLLAKWLEPQYFQVQFNGFSIPLTGPHSNIVLRNLSQDLLLPHG